MAATEAQRKSALIVAVKTYEDPGLRQLRAPSQDAEALAAVLRDPAIGGFEVSILLDSSNAEISRALERFFKTDRRRDDLLLVHFSCHGIKSADGDLYFAARDTDRSLLQSTAVSAKFVNDLVTDCRSTSIVLFLDCCYSGAFTREWTRSDGTVDDLDQLQGSGRVVLTASSALEYAFEGDALSGEGTPSYFTSAVVRGLRTGEAARNGASWITIDDLYEYVYAEVRRQTPNQTPNKTSTGVGRLRLARNPRPRRVPPDAGVIDEPQVVAPPVPTGSFGTPASITHRPDRPRTVKDLSWMGAGLRLLLLALMSILLIIAIGVWVTLEPPDTAPATATPGTAAKTTPTSQPDRGTTAASSAGAAPTPVPSQAMTPQPKPLQSAVPALAVGQPEVFPLGESVYGATFLPDGRRIVFVSKGGQVLLWDPDQPRSSTNPKALPGGHRNTSDLTSVSAGGQMAEPRILTTSDDGMAVLWSPRGDMWIGRTMVTHLGTVALLAGALSCDGQRVAIGGVKTKTNLFQWPDRLVESLPTDEQVYALAYSADGTRLVSGSDGGKEPVKVWSTESNKQVWAPSSIASEKVRGVAIDRTGTQVAASFADGRVLLWPGPADSFMELLNLPGSVTKGVAFSADGQYIATAGGDGIVRLFDAAASPKGSSPPIDDRDTGLLSVRFNRDGTRLVTAGNGGGVRHHRLSSQRPTSSTSPSPTSSPVPVSSPVPGC